jgi:transposase
MLRLIEGHRLDHCIEVLSGEIEDLARGDAGCERLMSVPGIGQSSLVQWSPRLGPAIAFPKVATSPPGSGSYPSRSPLETAPFSAAYRSVAICVLFVQAAWVTLVKVNPNRWQSHGLKPGIEAAKKRLHHNVLAIALANKLARIAWSVLGRGRASEASKLQAA